MHCGRLSTVSPRWGRLVDRSCTHYDNSAHLIHPTKVNRTDRFRTSDSTPAHPGIPRATSSVLGKRAIYDPLGQLASAVTIERTLAQTNRCASGCHHLHEGSFIRPASWTCHVLHLQLRAANPPDVLWLSTACLSRTPPLNQYAVHPACVRPNW